MYAMTDEAADRMNIPKLWDLMKKRGNKKKHDFDPAKERERIKQTYKLSIYDENGVRIVMDDDGVNSDNENDDYDKEEMERDYDEGNNENEEDDDGEEDNEGEEEEEEDEVSDAIKERNQRIKDKNREEEELDILKQQNKKLGRNVMIRTLSGKVNKYIQYTIMPLFIYNNIILSSYYFILLCQKCTFLFYAYLILYNLP